MCVYIYGHYYNQQNGTSPQDSGNALTWRINFQFNLQMNEEGLHLH